MKYQNIQNYSFSTTAIHAKLSSHTHCIECELRIHNVVCSVLCTLNMYFSSYCMCTVHKISKNAVDDRERNIENSKNKVKLYNENKMKKKRKIHETRESLFCENIYTESNEDDIDFVLKMNTHHHHPPNKKRKTMKKMRNANSLQTNFRIFRFSTKHNVRDSGLQFFGSFCIYFLFIFFPSFSPFRICCEGIML